jgi:hypothetical protein
MGFAESDPSRETGFLSAFAIEARGLAGIPSGTPNCRHFFPSVQRVISIARRLVWL